MNALPRGIKGLTDTPRYQRRGKIRLGHKKVSKSGAEYPQALDHFNFEDVPELKDIYGENCRTLEILIPTDDIRQIFDTAYKRYGANGMWKCRGNGEIAVNRECDDEIECLGEECQAFEKKECKRIGSFQFLLPRVPGGLSVFQIDTSGRRSIQNVIAGLNLVQELFGGIKGIPLLLHLEPYQAIYEDAEGKTHSTTHFCLRLDIAGASLLDVKRLQLGGEELPAIKDYCPDDLYPKGVQAGELQALPAPVGLVENPTPPQTLRDPEVADGWTVDPEVPIEDQVTLDFINDGFDILNVKPEKRAELLAEYKGREKELAAEVNAKVAARDNGNEKKPVANPTPKPAEKTGTGRWTF